MMAGEFVGYKKSTKAGEVAAIQGIQGCLYASVWVWTFVKCASRKGPWGETRQEMHLNKQSLRADSKHKAKSK